MVDQYIESLVESAVNDEARPLIRNNYCTRKSEYVDARTRISINCTIHGDFTVLLWELKNRPYLCTDCRRTLQHAEKTAALKASILYRFGNQFDLAEFAFTGCDKKVRLRCRHHDEICEISPYQLDKMQYICKSCRSEGLSRRFKANPPGSKRGEKPHTNKAETSKPNSVGAHQAGTPIKTPAKAETPNTSVRDRFIASARQLHGDRYDYSLVEMDSRKDRVWITCPIHGNFRQVAFEHVRENGCPDCGRYRRKNWRDAWKRELEARKAASGGNDSPHD